MTALQMWCAAVCVLQCVCCSVCSAACVAVCVAVCVAACVAVRVAVCVADATRWFCANRMRIDWCAYRLGASNESCLM
jgi:hypothetical protein